MEADRVAVALEHDDLGVVEQPLARRAPEGARGTHQRARQRVDGQVDHELGPDRPRVREHHDEEPERAHAAGHRELADVGPVDLCLLADQRLGVQVDFAARRRSDVGDVAAHGRHRPDVAAVSDHVVDPRRAKSRVLGQLLDDEVMKRLDDARPSWCLGSGFTEAQDALDHVGVEPELRRDRPDRPVLGVVQPHDLGVLRRRRHGHRTPRRSSWRSSRNDPSPRRRRPGSTISTW